MRLYSDLLVHSQSAHDLVQFCEVASHYLRSTRKEHVNDMNVFSRETIWFSELTSPAYVLNGVTVIR